MIKKMMALTFILLATGIFMAQTVSASLITNNDGTVYDDVSGLYWYQNLSAFTGMNYAQQITAISNITTGGFSWHLATGDDMASLIDNVGEQTLYGKTYPEASQITDAFIHTQYSYSTYFYMGIYEVSSTAGYHNIMEIQTRPDGNDNLYFVTGINNSQWTSDDRFGGSNTGAWVVADAVAGGSNPVPEPATMLLFGIGLLGLSGISRQRKQ